MNRSPAARGVSAVGALALLAALVSRGGVASVPVQAAAGPFQCQPGFYQVISGQLYELNPVTSTYTAIGSKYSTSYNAMGFNVLDDYLYAMGTGTSNTGDLLKIADDGSVADLGRPSGMSSHSFVSGDMDGSGHLLVQYSSATWYSIDVSTGTWTSFTVTGQQGSGNDVVWIDGYLYFASGTTLYTINLSTDVETSVNVSGLPSGGAYGAAWSDKPSDLFLSNNSTGDIYQLANFTGSSPSATQVATGDSTSDNDGAACKQAASPFVLPVASADTYSATTNVTLSVDAADGVLANDSGAGLTVLSHTNPADGTLSLGSDGSFIYVPETGFQGTDSFTYSVQDEYGRDSAGSATVTLDVTLPPAPQAHADSYSTVVGTTLSVVAGSGLLANDTGTGIAVASNTSPGAGSLTVNSDGSLSYVPPADASAVETFTYTIEDSFSRTSTAGVTIDVTPTVVAGSGSTAYATPLAEASPGVLSGAVGAGMSIASYEQPGHGSVTVSADGAFTYTPDAGFDGTDSFSFVAEDAYDQEVDGSFSIGVGAPAPPGAADYSFSIPAGTSLTETAASGLLSDDSGASITVTANTAPAYGSASVSGDGAFTYTPPSTFSGMDSFSYTITDAVGQSATGEVTVHVTVVAVDQTYSTPYMTTINVNVLAGDLGSDLSLQYVISAPASGDWGADEAGAIWYEPPYGFAGPAQFTYDFMDPTLSWADATVTFDVGDPPAPSAAGYTETTTSGQPLDVDAGSGLLSASTGYSIQVDSNTDPADGSVTADPDGSFAYVPQAGFSGMDGFEYTIIDPYGQTSTGSVQITVDPVATDVTYASPCGSALSVTAAAGLLSRDLGTSLAVESVDSDASLGRLDWQSDGAFTFTPAAGVCATSGWTSYAIEDVNDLETSATVTFTIGPPSSTLDLAYTVGEDGKSRGGRRERPARLGLRRRCDGRVVHAAEPR